MPVGTPEAVDAMKRSRAAGDRYYPDVGMDLLDRLTDRTIFDEDITGCWLWQGSRTAAGYGTVKRVGLSTTTVHRAGWEALRGPIPDGYEVDHLKDRCRNRNCWNPDHLEPVPAAENKRRVPGVGVRARALADAKARRTHCRNGHPFGADARVYRGARRCRSCDQVSNRRRRERERHRRSQKES
jgi:hypothetical protein